MDTTLSDSEPPFSPEKSTLSQLPFFTEDRVDGLPLPPTPPSICDECWQGPFAMHFGIPCVPAQGGKWYQSWPDELSYSTSFQKLASRSGCAWCQFVLREAGNACITQETKESFTVTLQGSWETWDADKRTHYQKLSLTIEDDHSFEGFVYTGLDDPSEPYISLGSPIPDIQSPRSMALARELIYQCIDGHEYCKSLMSVTNPRLLPKRLVDCTDLTRPRLVFPTDAHAEYVALSYVWGDSEQTHQTTISNEATYQDKIDLGTLPATIRDAIKLTHMLGFRWLWVDSLCILQDSDEDKAHEIGRMHSIYRYAHLTIIAASAESVTQGFLHKRPPPDNDVALPFICPPPPLSSQAAGNPEDLSVPQPRVGEVYIAETRLKRQSYGAGFACMATRAWCMQEYLMSPRSLIFTPRGLLFRCRDGTYTVGSAFRGIADDPELLDILFQVPAPSLAELDFKERKDIHLNWLQIVRNYSRRTASNESDKLVACAAVAEQFHRVLRADYVAGLWRTDRLILELLWSSDILGQRRCKYRHTRPTAYRAPSWSWAAIDGGVYTHPASAENPSPDFSSEVPLNVFVLAQVVDCRVTLENPALPFGRVTDGTLALRGVPIPCRGGTFARRGFLNLCWHVYLPTFEQAWYRQWGLGYLYSDEEDEDTLDWIEPADHANLVMDCDDDELPERMWVVPLLWTRWNGQDTVEGLVLELASPESRREKTRFRRIGHVIIHIATVAGLVNFRTSPLWAPLIRALTDGERLAMDIVVV